MVTENSTFVSPSGQVIYDEATAAACECSTLFWLNLSSRRLTDNSLLDGHGSWPERRILPNKYNNPSSFLRSPQAGLALLMSRMYQEAPKEYRFYPETWVLPAEMNAFR